MTMKAKIRPQKQVENIRQVQRVHIRLAGFVQRIRDIGRQRLGFVAVNQFESHTRRTLFELLLLITTNNF